MLNKKNLIYILISLLISALLVVFLVSEKEKYFSSRAKNVDDIKQEIQEIAMSWATSFSGSELDVFSWMAQIYTGQYDNLTLKELENYYSSAITAWDERQQAEVLETIYKRTKDEWLLYLLVDKYVKIFDYKKAAIYVNKIRWIDENLTKLWVKPFFNILFNSLEFTNKNVNDIKKILKIYKDKWLLDNDSNHFYHSIIALWKMNLDAFNTDISSISSWSIYQDYLQQVDSSYQQYKLYRDVAPYYLNWLLAFVMFENGYYTVAQKMSYDTLKLNDKYILPNQIIAYSCFIMNRYDEAKKYFTKLIEIDADNAQQYKFFLWVSHFWNKKYDDAIIFLSQLQSWPYIVDAYRYLLLSYFNINDFVNVNKYISKLDNSKTLNEYDYYTIFDLAFYKPYQLKQSFTIYLSNTVLIKKYLVWCYKNLPKNSRFICVYGRWGFYLANWEVEKTLKYLTHLVNYYPRDYIYEKIGDIYAWKHNTSEAKKYYVNAMLYSQDSEDKKYIKDKIMKTLLKK